MAELARFDAAFLRGLIAGVCLSIGGSAMHWLTFGPSRSDLSRIEVAVTIVIAAAATIGAFHLVARHGRARRLS